MVSRLVAKDTRAAISATFTGVSAAAYQSGITISGLLTANRWAGAQFIAFILLRRVTYPELRRAMRRPLGFDFWRARLLRPVGRFLRAEARGSWGSLRPG